MDNYAQKEKELKLKYNFYIKRFKKAEKFFSKCEEKEVDKYLPEFMNITREIDKLGFEIEKLINRKLTTDEVLEGFKEV